VEELDDLANEGIGMAVVTDQISGEPRTVRELFTGRKYGLKYYQREYTWSEANLSELLNDLSIRFLEEHRPDHERSRVASYRPYFLGPIVTANEEGTSFLVDGQQRLTTLTLLLIHLLHLSGDLEGDLRPLVYAKKFGQLSFNLEIAERSEVMHCILAGRSFNPESSKDESVRRLWDRYADLASLFPAELGEDAVLPFFIDWLLERVIVVEIFATDQDMALEMFETMNDRGSRLTPTDMLKSYLLARLPESEIPAANTMWRTRVAELAEVESTADADFLKAWLRSKYARNIRERKSGALPQDWDVIGSSYQKWVRDNTDRLNLNGPSSYSRLINRDFDLLSRRYKTLLEAAAKPTDGFEHVHYLAMTGFTLQNAVILAAVTPDDDDTTFQAKSQMVAGFLERLIAARMVNLRNYSYSQMTYAMFSLIKEIRDVDEVELRKALLARIDKGDDLDSFDAMTSLRLTGINGPRIRFLLARMTAWVDTQCRTGHGFNTYMSRATKDPFEIEHIWADFPDRHPEFGNEYQFADARNRIGGLLLLPKSFNASYGAMPYEAKVEHYAGQNLLARSLHPSAYDHNPSFNKLIEEHGLPFKPFPHDFPLEAMDERQELYRQLSELVWAPGEFGLGEPREA
jgi:uncharacterized protein with ParB-like and HNH nuclease domain